MAVPAPSNGMRVESDDSSLLTISGSPDLHAAANFFHDLIICSFSVPSSVSHCPCTLPPVGTTMRKLAHMFLGSLTAIADSIFSIGDANLLTSRRRRFSSDSTSVLCSNSLEIKPVFMNRASRCPMFWSVLSISAAMLARRPLCFT